MRARRTRRLRCAGDAGQVVVLSTLLVVAVIGSGLLLGVVARVVDDRALARNAADAAALAGAADGRRAAIDLARRNGGQVEGFEVDGSDVVVTVRVGTARATSRARRDVGGGAARAGVVPYTRGDGSR